MVEETISRALPRSQRILLVVIACVYFASTFLWTLPPSGEEYTARSRLELTIRPPVVIRGDGPYFLLMANSLARDHDFRLQNNIDNVLANGLDGGWVGRGQEPVDWRMHFLTTSSGEKLGKHPPGLPVMLALLLFPLSGTIWFEAAALWLVMAAALATLWLFARILRELNSGELSSTIAMAALAFATPFWFYARTLYTEMFICATLTLLTLLLLKRKAVWSAPALVAVVWLKYQCLLFFFSAGVVELLRRRWRAFILWGFAGAATLALVLLYNRWLFHDTTKFKAAAERGIHVVAPIGFVRGNPLRNTIRFFTDRGHGTWFLCPVVILGMAGFLPLWKRTRTATLIILSCTLPYLVFHLTYAFLFQQSAWWMRYLLPVLPLLMLGLPFLIERWSMRWFKVFIGIVIAHSFVFNTTAGLFPILAYGSTSPAKLLKQVGALFAPPSQRVSNGRQ